MPSSELADWNVEMRVLTHPDPALKQKAADVDPKTDGGLRALVRAMAEAMYEHQGVGLAAPQIGIQKRVIVFDVDDELHALCNPEIIERSEETELDEEGCLSVPGISVPIERSQRIVCVGLTLEGEEVTVDAEGFVARVIQHETDHLDGVLILDRVQGEARKAALRTYNEVHSTEGR